MRTATVLSMETVPRGVKKVNLCMGAEKEQCKAYQHTHRQKHFHIRKLPDNYTFLKVWLMLLAVKQGKGSLSTHPQLKSLSSFPVIH